MPVKEVEKCPWLANSARDKKHQILPVKKTICPWPCLEIVTSTFRDSRAVFCQSPRQIWLFCWKWPWLLPQCPWQFQKWWPWKFGTGPWIFLKRCPWTSENARDKLCDSDILVCLRKKKTLTPRGPDRLRIPHNKKIEEEIVKNPSTTKHLKLKLSLGSTLTGTSRRSNTDLWDRQSKLKIVNYII